MHGVQKYISTICYRNMEGEPVLKKASITQRQIGLHCVDFVSLFGDWIDVWESTLLRSQRSRASQQKSGSLTPERGWLTAKKIIHFALEWLEMSNIDAVCKEVRPESVPVIDNAKRKSSRDVVGADTGRHRLEFVLVPSLFSKFHWFLAISSRIQQCWWTNSGISASFLREKKVKIS